ncbi:MAG: FprA family A-type flavoprotein [Bacteroidales bacterium]|nr:FprA family A-type flavoprotein [Bacteroidales bacterium]
MKKANIKEITTDVKWIGALDPDLRTFDIVMETKSGTSYNSYFINADKKCIVETVKLKFWESYLSNLQTLCQPDEIEYIIVNHTEPDHSGSLCKLLELAPKAKVVGSGNCIRYLKEIMNIDFKNIIVKDGDSLDLGNKTLQFINAPNLHWPDSIYTYLVEDKLLFSCDSFGAHYCDENLFDDLSGNFDEEFKYYFDVILKPYSRFMLKAIEKIKTLDIYCICPGHGAVLRKNWKKYVELSAQYSQQALTLPVRGRVFIAYVSAYDYTGRIARKIAEGVSSVNKASCELLDIEKTPVERLAAEIEQSEAYIIGSPTINQNTLLQIYQLFAFINPIRDHGKLAAAFGSFGWSGEAARIIEGCLLNLKLDIFQEKLSIRFNPSEEELKAAFDFGKHFAEKLLNLNNSYKNVTH